MTQKYPEEIINVIKSGVVAALAGLLYGGLPAARHARQRYIQVSQAELYTSRVDAVVSERQEMTRRWSCMCDKLTIPISSFRSVQSALGTQCSDPWFCEIRMEVELEGGCFCNSVQVRKKMGLYHEGLSSVTQLFWNEQHYAVLLSDRFFGFFLGFS